MNFPFDFTSFDLPVAEIITEVKTHFLTENNLIIQAPPGAGKSTLLPLAILDEPWLKGKKILMLEPRRLATRSIAERMATMIGEKAGETVGYRIRFDSAISNSTRLEVITEGILTRMLHSDNALEEVGLVIFDEFHERNLHADVGLALCREVQEVLRPDLRILLMSATIDTEELAKLLGSKVIQSEGRQYPVEVNYLNEVDSYSLGEDTARQLIPLAKKEKGDFLVFLPGQGEIKKAQEVLKRALPNIEVLPLYGQLPQGAQQRAILPSKEGKQKIVLSTDIAETSLTIEGISVVVDSGYAKSSKFDPRTGLSRLVLHRISLDSANQRSGRAGRLSAGKSYRLWDKATQARLDEFRTPELMETDLTGMVLDMKSWGKADIASMTWLSPPPKAALHYSEATLESLDALEEGVLTPHGKEIHKLPCHPRIAHLLLYAEEHDLLALATDVAAILEERDPLPKEAGVDLNLRIEALRRYRAYGVAIPRIKKIDKVAEIYRRMFRVDPENGVFDPWQTGILLAYAYPERIASARPGNNAQFQLANGNIAQIGHKDDLAYESWLAVAQVDAREGLGKIWLAAPLNPKDLAPMLKSKEIIRWDRKKGGLVAQSEIRIGAIILGSRPLKEYDSVLGQTAIIEAIQEEGEFLLPWTDKVTQLIRRVQAVKTWNSDESWPDWSMQTLSLSAGEWLLPYLNGITKNDDFLKLDLYSILFHSLSLDQQKSLEELTPQSIEVPSGSKIQINYRKDGDVPLLSVRLQEIFGMLSTPRVNGGKVDLLIELLSPGFKAVQLTQDLKSFWENGYFEVRKELRRRYPKHEWPENPLEAQAIRGVKRKKP